MTRANQGLGGSTVSQILDAVGSDPLNIQNGAEATVRFPVRSAHNRGRTHAPSCPAALRSPGPRNVRPHLSRARSRWGRRAASASPF